MLKKNTPIGCFVGADADSVQSWHSQRRLRANYPSLNKHLRLSHQYILLYAILVIARIHATFVASSLSASALGVLQVFQHANLVLLCSKKTPYWVFCWSGRRDSNSRHSPWQGDALPLSHSRILNFGRLGKSTLYRAVLPPLPQYKLFSTLI